MQAVSDLDGERGRHLIKIEPGEKLVESLRNFVVQRDIRGGWISAIGAVQNAEIGWFDTTSKAYASRVFSAPLELVALTGNIARHGDTPVIHAHVVCSDRNMQTVGGHLVEAECTVTVEVELRAVDPGLKRSDDPRFGLKLLDLG